MDYYSTLGVEKNASQEEIKKAYRKLAHKHHPDKGTGDEKKMKEINEAYHILGNQDKRAKYDQFGASFDGGAGGAGFDFSSFNFSDFGINDIFESFFNRGGGAKTDLNKGEDFEIAIQINLEDTLKGVEQIIFLDKMATCQRCKGKGAEPGSELKECFSCRGTGQVQQMKKTFLGTITRSTICPECKGEGRIPEKPCNVCKGEGRIPDREKVKVFVPQGVDSGQAIKFGGAGDAGRRGGKTGDLYARIFVKPHKIFKRRGDDLHANIPISFSQAVLGDEVEIKTLDNKKLMLKVPRGSEIGKILRITGKGIPHFSGWGSGDLYVKLAVETPQKLTKKQKDLLEQLKQQGL